MLKDTGIGDLLGAICMFDGFFSFFAEGPAIGGGVYQSYLFLKKGFMLM